MTKEESEAEFKQLCELLVQRGLASACLYDDTSHTAAFIFTPAGEHLRHLLRQLFDVPRADPTKLTPYEITTLVSLVLFNAMPPLPG